MFTKWKKIGYKNRKEYLDVFDQFVKPYLEISMEDVPKKEKRRFIRLVKRSYPKWLLKHPTGT